MSRAISRSSVLLVSAPTSVGNLAVVLLLITMNGAFIQSEKSPAANRREAAASAAGMRPGDAANGLKMFGVDLARAFRAVEVVKVNEKDIHKGTCGLNPIAKQDVMKAYDPDGAGAVISRASIVGCAYTQQPSQWGREVITFMFQVESV